MSTEAPAPLLIGAKHAAPLLGISPRKLWELTNCGQVPHVKVGRRVLYSPDDLRIWINRRKIGGDDPRK
jgi:predicted DNA-binding transcriptional regulator AlpA